VGPKGAQRNFLVKSTESGGITITMEGRPGAWSYQPAATAEAAQETVASLVQEIGRACWAAAIETAIHATSANLNELR